MAYKKKRRALAGAGCSAVMCVHGQVIPTIATKGGTLHNVPGFVIREKEDAIALVHGQKYYVTVAAINNAAGRLVSNVSSDGVIVRHPLTNMYLKSGQMWVYFCLTL